MELYPKLQLKLVELTNCDAIEWDTAIHLGFFTKAWRVEKFSDIQFCRSIFYYKLEINDELYVEKRWTQDSVLSKLHGAIQNSMSRKGRRKIKKVYEKTEALKEAIYALKCEDKKNE